MQLDPDLDLLKVALPILREVGKQEWWGWRGGRKESDLGIVWLQVWVGVEFAEWLRRWLGDGEWRLCDLFLPEI